MKRRRRLRWKAVLVFLALGGAISASGYALYRAQAREAIRAARDEAFRAAERGDTDDAIRLMETYISVYRDDSAAVRDLALRLDSTSKQPGDRVKVLFALDRALQLNPGDVETRRLAVNRALELHRWKDAQDHLAVLVQDFPQDAELQRRLGECAEGQGDTDRAIAQYDRAIALDRLQVDAYARQARLLRSGKGQQEKADALMNELRRAAPESVPARLALARYFRESGRAGEAAGDLEAAVRKAPDMAEVRLEAALHEIALEHLPAAEAHVRAGLARNADYLPLVKLRVELERRSGKAPGNDVRDLVRQTLAILDTNPRKTADVLDLLIDVGELAAARELLDGAQSAWLPGHLRDFLEARLRIAEEDYVRARELLERCRSRLAPSPELARYAHLLLGICQRRLGEPDQAAGSFRTALDITPAWAPAELELAAANVQRGQIEEAVAIYRGLMKVVPPARIVAARLMLHSILRRAPESRDWSPLEELLNEAPADLRNSDDWRLLHSELLSAQGKDSEARSELLAAITSDPKSLTCRLALAAVLSRQKNYAQAEESLAAAERECGDRVEIRLARANLARQRDVSSAGAVITGLMADRAKFGRADQVRLLSGLYHVAQQTDAGLTRLLATKLTELQPGRIDLWFGMLRLALADNDEAAARGLLRKLREQEGEGGAYWRCGEVAVALQFNKGEDTGWIAEAVTRAAEASRIRPAWGLPVLLLGELDERRGDAEAALQRYRAALELGERSPSVIRRTVQLLQARFRYDEAQDLLRKLPTTLSSDIELARLSVAALVGHESAEQTLSKAMKLAPVSSKEFRDHLWLAHVLASLPNHADDAEAAYRRAVETGPKAGETWVGLIAFLTAHKQMAKAKSAAAEAESKLSGPENVVPLASCLELLGESDRAERLLTDALSQRADDALLQRQLAGLYLRKGEDRKAEPILNRLSGGKSAVAGWARRHWAMLLVRGGRYSRVRDAQALLEQNLKGARGTPEDERAMALLMALQPGRRNEALKALEASLRLLPATADEQMLVAQLQEAAHNWPAARERLLAVASNEPSPRSLAYLVERLMRHDDPASASTWLERLEKLDPDQWTTVSLKARVLARTGRADEARLVLRQRIISAAEPPQILLAARLLEDLGFMHEAQQGYLRYKIRLGGAGAQAEWPLARFDAVQARLDEALKRCETMGPDTPPEVVPIVAAAVAHSPRLDDALARRLEAWLGACRRKHPSASILLALADLHEQRNNHAEAQALYEEVLAADPHNIAALNNAAALLALRGQGERALKLANTAIESAGPLPALMDTRGLANLVAGHHQEALSDFDEALVQQESAVRRYHLALAQKAAGDAAGFAENLKKAKELNLAESSLHPLERTQWRALSR